MTNADKIIKNKMGLIKLAEQLGSQDRPHSGWLDLAL
jgi:hypothetical protein